MHDISIEDRDFCRIIRLSKTSERSVFRLAKDPPTTKKTCSDVQTAGSASHDLNPQSPLGFTSLINQQPCNRQQMRLLPAVEVSPHTTANSDRFKRFKRFETLRYKLTPPEFTHRKRSLSGLYNVQVTGVSQAAGLRLI